MDVLLNSILNLSKEEIENTKIEINDTAGPGGERYIDKWLSLDETSKHRGINDCSYWGWHSKNTKNFSLGQVVFSFVRLKPNGDEWLFVSVGKIIDIPPNSRAKVEIIEKYAPLFGRLIIKHKKTDTYGRYIFKANTILDKCIVKEITPCLYSGESFEGYDRVHLPYHRLASIFSGKIQPTYYEALRKITGVYCLTDTCTGKLYIGSATGEEGVAQRWGNYLDSKHGGNKKLIALYEQKGEEYFEKYFHFTLIEYFGLSYDPIKILEREQYWKKCFDTIENGYNNN